MTKADSESKKIYSNQHPKGKTPTGGGSDFQTSGTRIKAYGKTPKVKIEKLVSTENKLKGIMDTRKPSSFILGPTDKPSKNESSKRNRPYIDIDTEVKNRMKKETPKTFNLLKGFSPVTHLRKRLTKQNILKELKDRPENLSPPKIKTD